MTTTEIPAYTREDTQEKLTARQISRELARRDGHDGGYTPAVPGWVHPLWDGMPAVAADRGTQRMDYARGVVGYEHARHAAAQWRDLAVWCASLVGGWTPTAELPRTEWAELPPSPYLQLAPDVLDAEHGQQPAVSHPQTERLAERRKRRPAPVQTAPEGPQPRDLLRAELREFWADVKRLPSELRAWRPWKRGER